MLFIAPTIASSRCARNLARSTDAGSPASRAAFSAASSASSIFWSWTTVAGGIVTTWPASMPTPITWITPATIRPRCASRAMPATSAAFCTPLAATPPTASTAPATATMSIAVSKSTSLSRSAAARRCMLCSATSPPATPPATIRPTPSGPEMNRPAISAAVARSFRRLNARSSMPGALTSIAGTDSASLSVAVGSRGSSGSRIAMTPRP